MSYETNRRNAYIKNLIEHGGKEVELFSNFVHLEDHTKILILDSIIDHAKDVYGPFSGVYGEVLADLLAAKDVKAEDAQYVKSSDGHSFFNRLNFGSKYAMTILKAVQQQTKYITGHTGKTSRDGTTSLAMISSLTAKNFIMNNALGEKEVPKNIKKLIQDTLTYTGSSMMNDDAKMVYDAKTFTYSENGKEFILNAINTTVSNYPGFAEQFKAIMDKAETEKYDVINCYAAAPERIHGDTSISIQFENGIKMKVSSINNDEVLGFRQNKAELYIMDGYIDTHNINIFKSTFSDWLGTVCLRRDADDRLMYSKHNPNGYGVPVILITRVPKALEDFYADIAKNGFQVRLMLDGRVVQEVIKPIILLAHDVNQAVDYYSDVVDVYKEIRVNLNGINRYLNSVRKDEISLTSPQTTEADLINNPPLSDFFPFMSGNKIHFREAVVEFNADFNSKVVKEIVNNEYDFNKVVVTMSYDGNSFLMGTQDPEILDRMVTKRAELLSIKESTSSTSGFASGIDDRLSYFSGSTIKPIISCRSEDEWHNLVNLWDDALGVFTSVHAFGVMPGANTWFIKRYDVFEEKFESNLIHVLRQIVKNEELVKTYVKHGMALTKCIFDAYLEAYSYLDRNGYNERIHDYAAEQGHEDLFKVYNVITGVYDSTVLEATRTTADVFIGAIAVAFDLIELKRIGIESYNEWIDVYGKNNECGFHKINGGK